MNKTPALFDQRNEKKKQIEFGSSQRKDAKVGEIWRYYEGINIGKEISKDGSFMRPCIILQNNMGNGLLVIVPLTSKDHDYMKPYYIPLLSYSKMNLKPSNMIINQITHIDPKRLYRIISDKKLAIGLINTVLQQYYELCTHKKRP